ncbi:hypothetical protein D3C87_1211700 [compost metagenome]
MHPDPLAHRRGGNVNLSIGATLEPNVRKDFEPAGNQPDSLHRQPAGAAPRSLGY